jgi:phospholipase/carboxylesterase
MRPPTTPAGAERGRLHLPPPQQRSGTAPAGRRDIEVDGSFAGVCYVPPGAPQRLVILLHGAGGTAEAGLRLLLPHADDRGLALYAPKSVDATWDVIGMGYGPDVRRIQHAVSDILSTLRPAIASPAIGGFSDGASYALSLALANGDVLDRALAFSPGFAAPAEQVGRPAVFLSHGRGDRVLPIDRCGRRLARVLKATGYPVDYHEFDGGHELPPDIVTAAVDWLADVEAHR